MASLQKLRKWVQDVQVSKIGELDSTVEDKKTLLFGHQFITNNDSKSLFAVSADGSMHVQELHGFLENTQGKV